MSIKQSLYTLLSDDAGVSAMAKGIFPMVVPQQGSSPSRMPCLTYRQDSTDRQKTYCGTDGTIGDQFTVDAYGTTYASAQQMAERARDALIDYRGAVGDRYIADIRLENQFDLMDIEPGLYRVSMTYAVWHRAA